MKEYYSETFIVHYSLSDENRIDMLMKKLQEKLEGLLSFFELSGLINIINIYIYSYKDDYIAHMLKYTDTYKDWMIGDTADGNINMLSLDICRMSQAHKDMTLEQWIQVVTHELVHICQKEVNEKCIWM